MSMEGDEIMVPQPLPRRLPRPTSRKIASICFLTRENFFDISSEEGDI